MAYKAIVGGYVVPVGAAPIEGGTVLIEDGRITHVGAEADVEVPEDAELVDASGSWVLPGFIDAHAHLGVHEDGEGSPFHLRAHCTRTHHGRRTRRTAWHGY